MPNLEPEQAPEVVLIGPHRVVCGEDWFLARFVGPLLAEHMPAVNELSNGYARRKGYTLVLVDASGASAMTPEARRMTVDNSRKNPAPSAAAIFGTSLATRALATLLFKAIELLGGMDGNVAFFKTEAEARAWLDEQRVLLRARKDRK